jgi:hypothetical protein
MARKRRLRLILMLLSPVLVLLGLVLIAGLFLVFEHLRGSIALSRYQKALVLKGEKLFPQDLVRTNQAGENGAPELTAAAESFRDGMVMPDYPLSRMKLLPSGRAIVCFREPEWTAETYGSEGKTGKVTNTWEQVFADLEANTNALARIRQALTMPVFDHHLDYSNGPTMSFSHLAPTKGVAHWLGAAIQLKLQEGNNAEALGYLVDQIRLPRSMVGDQLLISELVRIAIGAIARTDTWEALQAEGWSDRDLLKIQQAWEAQSFGLSMVSGLEGERVFSHVAWERMHESNEQATQILFGMEEFFGSNEEESPAWESAVELLPDGERVVDFLRKQVYCRIWRFAWLDQQQLRHLKHLQQLINLARAASDNKSALRVRGDIDRLMEDTLPRGFYDRLRFPQYDSFAALSRSVDRAMRAETDRSMILAAIAIERYRLQHKATPADLEALVPALLPAVPTDYMDGKPIKYRLNSDGTFLLYSAGQDGNDDGGDNSQLPDQPGRVNLWNRKDYIWPQPARPEEVEAHRATGGIDG